MAESKPGPRKPATKFPHLQKKMLKNAIPKVLTPPQYGGKPKGK